MWFKSTSLVHNKLAFCIIFRKQWKGERISIDVAFNFLSFSLEKFGDWFIAVYYSQNVGVVIRRYTLMLLFLIFHLDCLSHPFLLTEKVLIWYRTNTNTSSVSFIKTKLKSMTADSKSNLCFWCNKIHKPSRKQAI